MKSNHNNTYRLLRHVNNRSLALAMFVALAFLGTSRGNETEQSASTKAEGSLEVYSASDEFNDGGLLYYAHSSYAIYTLDGKFFRNIENHISRSDENPETVSLPVGCYTVAARSERDGYIRIPVVIKNGRRTILALDR